MKNQPRRRPAYGYLAKQTSSRKRHGTGLFKIALLVIVLSAGYLFIKNANLPASLEHLKTKAKAATAQTRPVLSPLQTSQMTSQINSVIQNNPDMDIGVAIQDLNSNKNYHYGISDPFVAASVSKVLTATLFLHEVEQGQHSLDEQVGGYSASYELQQMIELSDNTAWQNLNDLLAHQALQDYANSIGFSSYDPDQNTLTVDDISMLLGKIYRGDLLNKSDSQLILSYMKDADFDSYIPASIPAGVKVYHKAGWLDDRVHDAAIIDNGKHPYVLVIFTKDDSGTYDETEGHQIFASITQATTKAFL